jgi:fused signal recognition particle receptor
MIESFPSMFDFVKKIFSPFSKIRSKLGAAIRSIFTQKLDASSLAKLEKVLYEADIGSSMTNRLIKLLKERPDDPKTVIPFLKEELLKVFPPLKTVPIIEKPHVILMVGINGSGKTTTLAKLASHYSKDGKKVLIGAGDTFRAAAIEQLTTWAKRIGVDIVKSQIHSDPSAVAFDALGAAKARGSEIVLIDTAGRLQTKTDLMQELAKMRRICAKQIQSAPHEILLVLDGTIGQNAIDQAEAFHEATPITGIVLTKLDGSAKGGIAIAIAEKLQIPILWVGLGEKEEDLIPFNPEYYLDALLS